MESLKDRAMVVNVHISLWGARKQDDKVKREIEDIHNVREVGSFTKKLMKSPHLEEINTKAGRIRKIYREMTLPWGDNGDRIITTDKYFEFLTTLGKETMEFDQLCDNFAYKVYVDQIEKERERLKTMFRESDYPHPDLIRDKFRLKTVFSPLTDGNDFRLAASDEINAILKAQMDHELQERVTTANDEILDKVRVVVMKMYETLSEPGKGFKSSLIGNVEALVDTIPTINIFNDTHITEVVEMLKPLCVNYDVLKGNDSFRQEIAKKAFNVLQNM
jgi:hypothetical protein